MGRPKGLLPAPIEESRGQHNRAEAPRGEPSPGEETRPVAENLVERLARIVALALPRTPLVLVGQRPEYAHLPWPALADARPSSGPLAGLVALLNEAERRGLAGGVALGCDFPYVNAELLTRLVNFDSEPAVLAPFTGGFFQPLVARYRTSSAVAARRRLAQGELSLQRLLIELNCARLPLQAGDEQLLRDWDEPGDLL